MRDERPDAKTQRVKDAKTSSLRAGRDPAIWVIQELLLHGEIRVALVRLKEYVAAANYLRGHSHAKQIQRVEQVFSQISGRPPWPQDATTQQLNSWRGIIGGILHEWPLAKAIDDLNATAREVRDLRYYIISDGGERASRWDMALCTHREIEWQKRKSEEAQQAREFFEGAPIQTPPYPPVNGGGMEPEWVQRTRKEIEIYEGILTQPDVAPADARNWKEEVEKRQMSLAQHGF